MVLDAAPNLVPGAWICPQAVIEIAEFADDADVKVVENSPDAAGVIIPSDDEEVIAEALRLSGAREDADRVRMEGVESLSREQLGYAVEMIEEHQDDLGSDAERVHERLV